MHSSLLILRSSALMKARWPGDTDFLVLTHGKIYDVLSTKRGCCRVVHNSGEDYLCPPKYFEIIGESFMDKLKIKRLDPRVQLPVRATEGSACFDLRAILDGPVTLAVGEMKSFATGIAIEMPSPDCVALVFSRSGMGAKYGVSLANSVGVIDSDYRGEIRVTLINHGSADYTVNPDDRIAQLMVIRTLPLTAEFVDALSDTERGAGGFGSTGKG